MNVAELKHFICGFLLIIVYKSKGGRANQLLSTLMTVQCPVLYQTIVRKRCQGIFHMIRFGNATARRQEISI